MALCHQDHDNLEETPEGGQVDQAMISRGVGAFITGKEVRLQEAGTDALHTMVDPEAKRQTWV